MNYYVINNDKWILSGVGKMFYQDGFPISISIDILTKKGFKVSMFHIADELLKQNWKPKTVLSKLSEEKTLDIDVSEFAEWDALFIEKLGAEIDEEVSVNPEELDAAKEMDMKIALALEECDALSKTRNIGF